MGNGWLNRSILRLYRDSKFTPELDGAVYARVGPLVYARGDSARGLAATHPTVARNYSHLPGGDATLVLGWRRGEESPLARG
jgi:hypothetical protein